MADLNYSLSVTGDCSQTSSGAISITMNGGTPPYNISWQTPLLGTNYGVTESTRTGLSYGDYSLYITDSSVPTNNELYTNIAVSSGNCCSITYIQSTTCNSNNGVVTVQSIPNSTYTIFYLYTSNDDLVSQSTSTIPTFTFGGLSAGTYYVVSDNIGGCSGKSETFIIDESSQLNFGLYVVPNSSCGIGPLGKIYVTGITGTPPYTYNWSNGGTGDSITGLTGGDYSVNVVDGLGCSKIMSGTVTTVGALQVIYIISTPPTCLSNNGTINIQLTGGTPPFYYSASTGYVEISYTRDFTLSGVGAGTYSFNITDAAFCQTSTLTQLNTPSGMTSVSVVTTNSTCSLNDGSLSATIQGGNLPYTYTLLNPDNTTSIVTTNLQYNLFSSLSGGTYDLTIEDSSGCTFTNNYTITTDSKFSGYTEVTGTTYGQTNGSVLVYISSGGTSPYNYTLDGNQSVLQTSLTAVTFNYLSKGNHTITVSDAEGCSQTLYVYLDSEEIVDFLLYPTDAGKINDGTITAFISSGVPPFTFNWSDNVSGNPQNIVVSGLSGGSYSLTIIDGNGSVLQRTTKVNQKQIIVSYEEYIMGDETFKPITNSKYSISKMFNEGYNDLISENVGCQLGEATFTTKVYVEPYAQEITETFFSTDSLLKYPSDNEWYDSIKSLVMSIQGVGDVIINEIDNQIKIISDKNNLPIIDGEITKINIKVYLIIDYEIKCNS